MVSDSRDPILELRQVSKHYLSGEMELTVLHETELVLREGETCALMGPSGSGKSTLLSVAAGLLQPNSGDVLVAGQSLTALGEDARAELRRSIMGFVFQNFNLVPTLTALENVMLPLELAGVGKDDEPEERAREAIASVGLAARERHYSWQLSGGEQQRVAIARAFVHRPRLIFADEPTGSLDGATGDQIAALLFDLNRKNGTTLLLVTHNSALANSAGRIVKLEHGRTV